MLIASGYVRGTSASSPYGAAQLGILHMCKMLQVHMKIWCSKRSSPFALASLVTENGADFR